MHKRNCTCALYTCSLIHVSFMNLSPFQCSNRIPHRWSHYPTLCLISSTPLPPIPLSPIPPFHCLTELLSPYLIPLEPSHQTTPHPSLITHIHTHTQLQASTTAHRQPYIPFNPTSCTKCPPRKKKNQQELPKNSLYQYSLLTFNLQTSYA